MKLVDLFQDADHARNKLLRRRHLSPRQQIQQLGDLYADGRDYGALSVAYLIKRYQYSTLIKFDVTDSDNNKLANQIQVSLMLLINY